MSLFFTNYYIKMSQCFTASEKTRANLRIFLRGTLNLIIFTNIHSFMIEY